MKKTKKPKYKAGQMFYTDQLDNNFVQFILLEYDGSCWSCWCSRVYERKAPGVIDRWRDEKEIDRMLEEGSLKNVDHYESRRNVED
jgi:hypothetical protein